MNAGHHASNRRFSLLLWVRSQLAEIYGYFVLRMVNNGEIGIDTVFNTGRHIDVDALVFRGTFSQYRCPSSPQHPYRLSATGPINNAAPCHLLCPHLA